MPLGEWLRQYLAPGGSFYRAAENYHAWEPGKKWDYCRVAHGLAGHLVESIARTSFPDYCRQAVFEPLEMNETSWYLAGIDPARHAVPYTWVSPKGIRGPAWGGAISNPVAGVALRWKSTRRSAVIEGRICPRLSPRVLKSTLACA